MNSTFNAFYYFTDFLIISIVILPLFFWVQQPLLRRIILILAGNYLLFVIAPRLLIFYLLFWSSVWMAQVSLARVKQRTPLFAIMMIIFLIPLVSWKLFPTDFNIQFNLITHQVLKLFSQRWWEIDATRHILIPIGFSFAIFRAIDLLIQTYLGTFKALTLDRILYFGFFPPVLVVGPIIEYREIESELQSVSFELEYLIEGMTRIIIGMTKIFVLAYPLQFSSEIFLYFNQNSPLIIWTSLLLFSWFFYLNFAGYADIAIGTARLYGFQLQENFNFPYFRQSIQAFWANWHISLTRFAQRNVFIPVGGFRPKTQYLAIMATIMVIALWHDISLSLVLFGCYHGFALCLHRYWDNRRKMNHQKPSTSFIVFMIKMLSTFLFVMLGFPLMMLPFSQIVPFYLTLFGF